MSGRPRRVAAKQSYINWTDARSYGGMKKSGYGKEGGREAIHFFTEQKTICRAI